MMCVVSVKSGVMSAVDTDVVLRDALGLRWALLGALETCHLNAPTGKLLELEYNSKAMILIPIAMNIY